jgi:hypothetical protein
MNSIFDRYDISLTCDDWLNAQSYNAQKYYMDQLRAQENMKKSLHIDLGQILAMNLHAKHYPITLGHGPRIRSTAFPDGRWEGL